MRLPREYLQLLVNDGRARQLNAAAPATLEAVESAAGQAVEPVYTREELERMIDQDRVTNFMRFVRAMPADYQGSVFGVAAQARSIARELEKLGY